MADPLLGSTSRLERALLCPASSVLHKEERESGEAAKKGKRIHRFLELAPEDKELALREAGKNRKTCEKIDITETAGYYTKPDLRERGMVFHADSGTVTVLPKTDQERHYGVLTENDVPGTADVIIPGFSSLEIADYKTGRHPVFPRHPETGKPNIQLLHLAMMAGLSIARHAKTFVLTIQQLLAYGKWKTTSTKVDRFDIEEHAERVQKQLIVAKKAKEDFQNGIHPKTVVGSHCTYCPCQAHCPEWS